jgi:methylisocitrate lyase
MLIIARTDARSVTGIEDAIARGQAYAAAGADIIFPEGLQSLEEFATFRRAVTSPLMANMTEFGKTPYLTEAQFRELGYALVVYPVSNLRLSAKAMEIGYQTLKNDGTLEGLVSQMLTRQELYDVIKYKAHEDMARDLQKNR